MNIKTLNRMCILKYELSWAQLTIVVKHTYKWVKKIISDGSYEETTDIDASRNHARTEHTAA